MFFEKALPLVAAFRADAAAALGRGGGGGGGGAAAPTVGFETHRGRVLGHPRAAVQLLDAFPEVRRRLVMVGFGGPELCDEVAALRRWSCGRGSFWR